MDNSIRLLEFIFKNAKMGSETIEDLIDINEDLKFRDELIYEKETYDDFVSKVNKLMKKMGKEAKDLSFFTEMQSYLMIKMETLKDKSSEHIAGMLMQGSTMGIVQITKKLREYKDSDKDVVKLAERLLEIEEKNFYELKKYL
ncbi:hypothetical protein [Anaerofustis stercorihominis]|uniref:DUF2383 domain-containing protein n=2 Tax=Anaerofustis stercorihominis TaxID=214853 RepID=B1CAE1_9FIRM|nr:hypothetical protein [Anaerofustis stercorihominis]EDS72414.1 hypothetical protein ANASTE_02130 [Anaerofustis stercorihominis DSM 17244]MCQ4795442.1 hypothetical protein [Anaerofustis stercorihominis]RGD72991.1 hypothetical protein DW687_11025 [Anaerofustis stercorihominis]